MIQVQQITMQDSLYQQERVLRNMVLLRPAGIADFGWEMFDKASYHFVAVEDNKVLGCVMLYPENKNVILKQMAVEEAEQKRGIGSQLIQYLIQFAQKSGIEEIHLHAQERAIGFYLKNNFEIYGEPFEEVGIMHRHMKIKIN